MTQKKNEKMKKNKIKQNLNLIFEKNLLWNLFLCTSIPTITLLP